MSEKKYHPRKPSLKAKVVQYRDKPRGEKARNDSLSFIPCSMFTPSPSGSGGGTFPAAAPDTAFLLAHTCWLVKKKINLHYL